MGSFYFETFGCQMNVADSDSVSLALMHRGYTRCETAQEADLLIVNTCSVREHAEVRAKMRLSQFAALKRSSQSPKKLWVIGCMAERAGDSLRKEIRGIDAVIGATRLEFIDQFIDGLLPISGGEKVPAALAQSGPSIFVPITRGCDNFCTYCIVPYVRGREHSIPAADIETQVRQRVELGAREITLLGQNVNSYRENDLGLPVLLRRLEKIDGLLRIRFTTSHPKDCSLELLDTMAASNRIVHHMHVPVQAGSDRVLDAMNRGYTKTTYLKLIDAIKTRMPHADITTDVMVGFPSETESEFKETLDLFTQVQYTQAFMFAYSPREGTVAAQHKESISEEEKKTRLAELIDIQTAITKRKYQEMVGQNTRVLITCQQDGRDRLWMGQNSGSKKTLCSGENIAPGDLLDVKVVRSTGMTLMCERIS